MDGTWGESSTLSVTWFYRELGVVLSCSIHGATGKIPTLLEIRNVTSVTDIQWFQVCPDSRFSSVERVIRYSKVGGEEGFVLNLLFYRREIFNPNNFKKTWYLYVVCVYVHISPVNLTGVLIDRCTGDTAWRRRRRREHEYFHFSVHVDSQWTVGHLYYFIWKEGHRRGWKVSPLF